MPAQLGFVCQPHFEDYATLQAEIADLLELRVKHPNVLLRLVISWADWARENGDVWTQYVVESWACTGVRPLVTFMWTPPSWSVNESANAHPRDLELYWEFVRQFNAQFAEKTEEWQQHWMEANGQPYWDRNTDPDWQQFASMHIGAARISHAYGKRVLMPGIIPSQGDRWLALMCSYGVVQEVDAVAVHAFPGTWLPRRTGVHSILRALRVVLHEHGLCREIWIPEYSYSTAQGARPHNRAHQWHQLRSFQKMLRLQTPRVYWHSLRDLSCNRQSAIADHCNAPDLREHGCGIKMASGRPKLLWYVLVSRSLDEIRTLPPDELAKGW